VNTISANDLERISIEKFVSYLEGIDWIKVDHPNDKIFLFEGVSDDEGEPLQLVIPRSHDLVDANARLSEALTLLAMVHRQPVRFILNQIIADDNINGASPSQVATSKPLRMMHVIQLAIAVVFGAVLTAVVGSYLISYQIDKREQAELNRIRVNKIAEVLAAAQAYDTMVERVVNTIQLLNESSGESSGSSFTIGHGDVLAIAFPDRSVQSNVNKGGLEFRYLIPAGTAQINPLHEELERLMEQNKFWLGEELWKIIKDYTDDSKPYYAAVKGGEITKELEERRRQTKTQIDRIRDTVLRG
jgi:hypothetical protein